jgi:hypothetical protein
MQEVILTAGAARHPFRHGRITAPQLDRTFSTLLLQARQTPLRSFGVGLVYVCARW